MADERLDLPVDTVPPAFPEYSALLNRISDLETNVESASLDAEADQRRLLIQEIRQRIRMRYFAIGVAVTVICGMGFLSLHVVHKLVVGPLVLAPPAVVVAMFVAPVVSISAITIMLMVGAFRRFKDDDMDKVNIPSLMVEAANTAAGRPMS